MQRNAIHKSIIRSPMTIVTVFNISFDPNSYVVG